MLSLLDMLNHPIQKSHCTVLMMKDLVVHLLHLLQMYLKNLCYLQFLLTLLNQRTLLTLLNQRTLLNLLILRFLNFLQFHHLQK